LGASAFGSPLAGADCEALLVVAGGGGVGVEEERALGIHNKPHRMAAVATATMTACKRARSSVRARTAERPEALGMLR
jgi:hypothetical protein